MLSKTATPLRTAAASCRLQPAISIPSISTRQAQEPKSIQSTSHFPSSPTTKSLIRTQTRHISTFSPRPLSTRALSTTTNTTTPSDRADPQAQLTWNAFFTLRKHRRWWQVGSSVVCCLASTLGGISTIAQVDPTAFASAIPQIDPLFTMGAATMGFGVAGWMLGPFCGSGIWGWKNRGVKRDMALKEKQFFQHVKKYRVDPSGSSMNNPVPDYYGEKIESVKDYRRWLKDQRAFDRKKKASIL